MGSVHHTSELDEVLAMQLLVAWAGEGRCQPKRFGWWETDLIDPEGGGDFFARLLPRTHAWASLEAAREAARRVDARARASMAKPDAMRTIFFLGYDVDERVDDRLAALKREPAAPGVALPFPTQPASFVATQVITALRAGAAPADPCFRVVPGGRQLAGPFPRSRSQAVRSLAAVLASDPLPTTYPLPFFSLEN